MSSAIKMFKILVDRGIISDEEFSELELHLREFSFVLNRLEITKTHIDLLMSKEIIKAQKFQNKDKAQVFLKIINDHYNVKEYNTPLREKRHTLYLDILDELSSMRKSKVA